MLQLWGSLPPEARRVAEKGASATPNGKVFEVIISAGTTGALAFTVTVAEALLVGWATMVAVTMAVLWADTEGAVNKPVLEMLPALAVQVTLGLCILITATVNCCVA